MNDLVILKLGGSVITKKEENKSEVNKEVLEKAAQEIKRAKDENGFSLMVVCGVGPFGHSNVEKYGINNGVETEEQMAGVKETNAACGFVGEECVKALKKAGLKAKHVSAEKAALQENKKVESFSAVRYERALEKGLVPVSTGIMVPDTKLVWSVISGDQIIAQLAKKLGAKKVLIGTDVDGIFSANPKENAEAELIPEVTKENLEEVLKKTGGSKSVDVTEGMKGKIAKLAESLEGIPAEIFNLNTKQNLEKALKGETITGTKIMIGEPPKEEDTNVPGDL